MKHLRQAVFACVLLCSHLPVYAGNYLLVNSGSGEIYEQFTHSLSEHLSQADPDSKLTTVSLDAFKNSSTYLSRKHTAIISTGIEAAKAISQANIHDDLIMAMMPRLSYRNLSKSGEIVCHAPACRVVFLDQPIRRQLDLIKLVFPDIQVINVIGSQRSAQLIHRIQSTAKLFGFHINRIIANNQNELISALNEDLIDTGILMAIPDPVVYNRDTARAILLATFNRQIPLFAYSRSFVLAGAVIGIFSTPQQIAHHIAELLINPEKNHSDKNQIYPKYFSISTNQRAAEALNVTLPKKSYLIKRLEADEKN